MSTILAVKAFFTLQRDTVTLFDLFISITKNANAFVVVFPERGGGGPRAIGGGIGDFVGIFQHVCAPVVGEMKGF